MRPVEHIIFGDYILTMNERMDVIKNGAIAVEDARIVAVDAADVISKKYNSESIIEGKDRVVLPGLINTHTHAAMVYFRGLADDLPLKEWLENHIWPAENKWLSPEFVSDAVELACLEMLKAGITAYNDMYFYADNIAASTKKMGMRAMIGAGIVDFRTKTGNSADDYIANAERFISDYKNDDLIYPCFAPHSAYACGPDTLKKIRDIAERLDVAVCIHLSETQWEVGEILSRYGKRPAAHLDSLGFLNERLIAAHCVWLDDEEIGLLAKSKTGVSHCIESNLKLASGIAPIDKMLKAGVKVSLGTDGAASNNNLDIIGEMSTAAKVHKTISNDPTAIDAKTVLLMATKFGADVLGLSDKIGSIKEGMLADIVSINLRKPHLMPMYDIYSHLVYSASAHDVETVMVNGKLLIDRGKFTLKSEEDILNKAFEWGKRIG